MGPVRITEADSFFFERQKLPLPHFTAEDYLARLDLLTGRMREKGVSHVVIYGDREHFSNIEYFSSYDCRFEEALLVVDKEGGRWIIAGNEGMGYSYQIPYPINRMLCQHFSLQGQPRDSSLALEKLLEQTGIRRGSRVGVVGYKYFYPAYTADPLHSFDVPMYMMEAIFAAAGRENVENFTSEITGLPDGIRMRVYTPKEIAWAEYSATKSADVLLNLFDALEVGGQELETSRYGKIDFTPVCMYSLVNFGAFNLSLGLRSPDDSILNLGDPCGLCYGARGSLTSRTGIAASSGDDWPRALAEELENFYMPFWSAIAAWYETIRVGTTGGTLYDAVMKIIGGPEFGVALNPGHNTGMDEWTNSPVYRGSTLPVLSGAYMQCDIIASRQEPYFHNAICEDTVIIADETLRAGIAAQYPEMHARIRARQEKMRSALGIRLDDSVLPMSNLNGVYFPFMLDISRVFAK